MEPTKHISKPIMLGGVAKDILHELAEDAETIGNQWLREVASECEDKGIPPHQAFAVVNTDYAKRYDIWPDDRGYRIAVHKLNEHPDVRAMATVAAAIHVLEKEYIEELAHWVPLDFSKANDNDCSEPRQPTSQVGQKLIDAYLNSGLESNETRAALRLAELRMLARKACVSADKEISQAL